MFSNFLNLMIEEGLDDMKIKVAPLVLTVALSVGLLFGGWAAYRHYAVEQPLDRIAAAAPGVQSADAAMANGQVVMRLQLESDADLAGIYKQIKQDGAGQIGGKPIKLDVQSQSSEKLEQAWRYSLFDIAEAMETRRYSGIRDAMGKLGAQFPGVTAETDMDEDNVYIRLQDGQAAKFIVLPRQAATLEVWPNA